MYHTRKDRSPPLARVKGVGRQQLIEFVFNFVYVDQQYDKISLIFTAGHVCLCSHLVVLVPCVTGAVTVICVLFLCVMRVAGSARVTEGNAGVETVEVLR